jgi:hypothetical protein
MSRPPTVYGLFGITHGWAKVLTVMSPDGGSAASRAIGVGDEVIVEAGEGQLTRYVEKRKGALDRLIAAHGIVVLSPDEWTAKKAELGEAIWR